MNQKFEPQTFIDRPEVQVDTDDETNLVTVSTIVLLVGIGIFLFSLVTQSFITIEYPDSEFPSLTEKKQVFNPSGFIASIGILMGSILLRSLLRVISNISVSLKELNANK